MNQSNKSTTSQYTCGDYREEMILLALRQKLKKVTLTQEEKKSLKKKLSGLKKKLASDSP